MALITTFGGQTAGAEDSPRPPEAITATSKFGMVAADQIQASQAGADILERGGNAVDAAVGALLANGVVNPFASGLGGGGFCLVQPAGGEVAVLDFRERAPGNATRDMYLENGEVNQEKTVRGGLAVAVPGEPEGLQVLQAKYGQAKWKDVVAPAQRLASKGFVVGATLEKRVASRADDLARNPKFADEFKIDGKWVTQGQKLQRPELGNALKLLAEQGARPFYDGPIAQAIVATVNEEGGIFTAEDLTNYEVTWREPLVGSYHGYTVYSMPPPSSGGTTILAALNILERYDLKTLGQSTESTHRIAEALKHAFADRAEWLGDADFVDVPVERLVSKEYAAKRVIRPDGVLPAHAYGTRAAPPDDDGTTHVSVIDASGTSVACTSTINTSFGSMVFVDEWGLVMNNEMADFTAQPGVPNNYGLVGTEQNAVAPGKRPLSSMSPTIVTRDGKPFMAVGASGGPTIITGTLLAMIRIIDWNTSPAEAITLPRLHHQWMPPRLFIEAIDDQAKATLERRGHQIDVRGAYNSVQMVLRKSDGTFVGVSDPRKAGRPAGAKK